MIATAMLVLAIFVVSFLLLFLEGSEENRSSRIGKIVHPTFLIYVAILLFMSYAAATSNWAIRLSSLYYLPAGCGMIGLAMRELANILPSQDAKSQTDKVY